MKKLLEVAAVGALLIIGTTFLIYMMAATDEGVDVEGTAYEDQHNSSTDLAILTISIMKFIAPILGVVGLIVAVFYIKKVAK